MMRISRVTLTGADDSVKPEQLVDITKEFPFVEWGILFSPQRQGTHRYPSKSWVREFISKGLPCAAHLCGLAVDEFVNAPRDEYSAFGRVQLNFSLSHKVYLLPWLSGVVGREKRPIIFQANKTNRALLTFDFIREVLFDGSGGRGRLPSEWPVSDPTRVCGYAGGLGPDNLAEQLPRIASAAGDEEVWIDMEGKLRSDQDRFDLDKATSCLRTVASLGLVT